MISEPLELHAGSESARSGVSWPAIFAGALAATVLAMVLLILGSGLGLASLSAMPNEGTSVKGMTAMVASWLIIMQWLSSALGGYMTGRLRCKWVGLHDHEVFFRDTAHGFLAWAVAAILSVLIAASMAAHLAKMGHGVMEVPAGKMHVGMGPPPMKGGPMAGDNIADPFAYYVDSLFRADHPVTDVNTQDMRAESERILINGAKQNGVSEEDRLYLAQLVSTATGIASSDAEKRVSDVLDREKSDEAKMKQLADDARKASSLFSIYTALSMVIGAFIASVAAALGGALRDRGWGVQQDL